MKAQDVDAYLAGREADVRALRPGLEKEVIWAGETGAQTDWAVVYVHGFSASKGELRPMPDEIAKALGANLHYTRLSGHGQDGPAMAEPDWTDWLADVQEALAVGTAIGRRVLVICCSTGGTLVTKALSLGGSFGVKAVIFMSPNFALSHPALRLLFRLPGVARWAPVLLGRERHFEPINAAHEALWTTRYPTKAVFTMREAMNATAQVDKSRLSVPALFVFSDGDKVVWSKTTRAVAKEWGGPATVHVHQVAPGDDENEHVLAGDALSPGGTAPLVRRCLDWLGEIGFHRG